MKKTYFLLLCLMSGLLLPMQAQNTMRRFLESTPDSVFMFVTNDMFVKLSDYERLMHNTNHTDSSLSIGVQNRFEERSALDSLAADYASLTLSDAFHVQLMALPVEDADTIVCMVKTYDAPEPESTVSFYDLNWRQLSCSEYLTQPSVQELYARPDSMSEERFVQLTQFLDPLMVHIEAFPRQKELVFSLSTPLLNKDEILQINAILLQRKVKWSGKTFKKI